MNFHDLLRHQLERERKSREPDGEAQSRHTIKLDEQRNVAGTQDAAEKPKRGRPGKKKD